MPRRPDCIEWTGVRMRRGYGKVGAQLAHRVLWQSVHGSIPPGSVVMHECDHPPCINIKHLRLGTQAENLADMRSKGRGSNPPTAYGEQHHAAKLTEEQVRQIRALGGTLTQRQLAANFGVAKTSIAAILHRKTWIST